MCYDDFDFDGFDDGMGDPDDDFQEDMFDEFKPDADEFDIEAESGGPDTNELDGPEIPFDFQDAFIIGGMIVGQAYEEALDEKEQKKQQDNKEDGDDLI